MNIAVILGTRPEIIKLSPVLRAMDHHGVDYFVLHTGQHYSYNLDKCFFDLLSLRQAKYNLEVGSGSHANQTGKIMVGAERILSAESPDVVLVQGDTNTVLGGALAATKLKLKVGHVEAGLRSKDRTMPEEVNRILTDHCSDFLFAPTLQARQILLCEGFSEEQVFVSGNTIVDALYHGLNMIDVSPEKLIDYKLKPQQYFLVTLHRQENVDNKLKLESVIEGLKCLHSAYNLPVIFPVHPRTRKRIEDFDIKITDLVLLDPIDYLNFLKLERDAALILTDSGGIQEEACILHVPCVTLRDNTERPESVSAGGNVLAGTNPESILKSAQIMMGKTRKWENPFGDGHAGESIIRWLHDKI